MARVVPVGPIDPVLYAFAKKEAEKAERNPRYVPKNCPADRGQIIYKRIGNAVKAIIRTIGEWGQVNFASSETAFFVADRKPLTTGKFYETRNSTTIYDPDAALELLNSAIATVELGGYSTDGYLAWFDNQFIYNDRGIYIRKSYPFLSLSDHTAYCLVDSRMPRTWDIVVSAYFDNYAYTAIDNSHSRVVEVGAQLNNTDIEFYRQNFTDEEVVPELLRTDRIFTGYVRFLSTTNTTNTDHIFFFMYGQDLSAPISGVVDGKSYCTYNEKHRVTVGVGHDEGHDGSPAQWRNQRITVIRQILSIDGVEQEIGQITKVEATQGSGFHPIHQSHPPDTFIEIRNDKTGKKTGDLILMAARCDGGGVYLFENSNVINDSRAYCTIGNEYGVFSVTEKESVLQLSWCNSQNMEEIYEDVHWLDDAPIVCNLPKFELEAAPKNTARYGIKTGHLNQIVLFDKFARKSLDITTMVKKRHSSLIDDGAFISQVQEAKWRSFDPGRPVNIITGLIDDNSISGFEYVVDPQKPKDKKITKYIRDNFEVDE